MIAVVDEDYSVTVSDVEVLRGNTAILRYSCFQFPYLAHWAEKEINQSSLELRLTFLCEFIFRKPSVLL